MAGALPAVEMRALIARQRRKDLLFVLLGVAALGLAFATFITLFLDMLFDGWSRLRPEFFTQFASRKAEQAGILAAWVGTLAVMVVTALVVAGWVAGLLLALIDLPDFTSPFNRIAGSLEKIADAKPDDTKLEIKPEGSEPRSEEGAHRA